MADFREAGNFVPASAISHVDIRSNGPMRASDSIGIEMAEMFKERPMAFHLSSLPTTSTDDTSRHEAMHGRINPYNVYLISVIPGRIGRIRYLGITVLRQVDPTATAAGLVHGKGAGGDRRSLEYMGVDVSAAAGRASSKLAGLDEELDLVARGISAFGTIDGDFFRDLIIQADWELRFKDRFGDFPPPSKNEFLFAEFKKNEIETQTNNLASIIASLPKGERFTINVDTEDNQTVTLIVKDGNIEKATIECKGCGAKGGNHKPGCPANKNANNPNYPGEMIKDYLSKKSGLENSRESLTTVNNSGSSSQTIYDHSVTAGSSQHAFDRKSDLDERSGKKTTGRIPNQTKRSVIIFVDSPH